MLSMSVSAGEHNDRHNLDPEYRAELPNVDHSKTKDNENIRTETIGQAYKRIFGAATEEHNARQVEKGHPERQIRDYLAKVRAELDADEKKRAGGDKWRKNRPDPCIEYVAQVGSRDTWAGELTEEEAKAILRETFERIRERTRGAIDWFQVAIHVDEPDGTPHIHMAGVPLGEGYKRGMPKRVSMRKAFETMGVRDLPEMQALFLDTLEEVAGEHGIERQVMGCKEEHKATRQYKQEMAEQQRLNEKNEAKRELGRELDAQNAEKQDRLECLQRQIEELEPAAVGIAESAGALVSHIGDAGREREVGSRVEELEQQVREARGRAVELEREVRGLDHEVGGLERAVSAAEETVRALVGRVGGFLRGIPEHLADMAAAFGLREPEGPSGIPEAGAPAPRYSLRSEAATAREVSPMTAGRGGTSERDEER